MPDVLPQKRSFTGHHDLLPASQSRTAVPVSMIPVSTLVSWTLGRGTVLWRIWPAVLMHTLFATAVSVASMETKIYLGIPNIMLTVLGVVIGFVISYRASSGYDRYWTGRTAWSDVMRTTRTLTRLIWFHVPLRLTPKTTDEIGSGDMAARSAAEVRKVMKEKNMAIDLVNGFVVALKHHLRGEQGIYYQDLYGLVRPLHDHPHYAHHRHPVASSTTTSPLPTAQPIASASIPYTSNQTFGDPIIPAINSYGSLHSARHALRRSSTRSTSTDSSDSSHERRLLLPSSMPTTQTFFSKIAPDLIPFHNAFRTIFGFWSGRRSGDAHTGNGSEGGVQRRWSDDHKISKAQMKHRPRIAGNGENLPLDILYHISVWLASLEDRGTVPGTSLGSMIGCIATFEDSLSTLEKILTTPLPFTVWIYLFFLPFQLVDLFGWYTIPGVAIASFIYLGFLAAGEEIEQPFGTRAQNDLDLDMFCREIVHADIERLKKTPSANVFIGLAHEEIV
ncbi:hypothetical protein HETIRDRAFT_482364 [Heterobasidion irregulare TC 32-1]|uniref:Uncharacterized protein n=1 Tax=Heterobasidion irregulare (strain TC 32-1) TaxID=747525 RepID=W4JNY5_HETIT|nr:uncharacterized protein HETIRDRAFT_482364 [Heterobasidion irregulare TC 32-1]ETW74596.1 hypothetical protein HETIRDRAFT_482364 [Heterobasidion irregulare TC 32-1]